MTFLVLVLVAYLLGSLPTGPVVAKRVKKVDIRKHGSGNTGAANVLRVAGPKAAAVVFTLDVLKGLIPVVLARSLLSSSLGHVLVGMAAIAGHTWSLFLGFKGGKGVLTSLGSLLALAPLAGVTSAATGAIITAKSRYSSLGSLTGTFVGAVTLCFLILTGRKSAAYLIHVLIPTALIVWTHRENIQRLLSGTENRLEQGVGKTSVSRKD